MRYLKTYKLFESQKENIELELRDICLELEDEGFIFILNRENKEDSIEFILAKKDYDSFTFSGNVIDVVDRLYQFMRELGWYSHLWYSLGDGIRKKFYIRPDGKMRDQDLAWIDDNWPSVKTIDMSWYKTYEDKIQESVNRSRYSPQVVDTLVWEYGEGIKDIIEDIHIIEDILLDIDDIGYFTSVGLSPMTMAGAASKPNLYVDIKNKSTDYTGPMGGRRREEFYGDLGEKRETVDEVIERVLNYLEDKGYKLKFVHDNREGKPSEFEFINNPTSYQMQFTK